MGFATQTLSVDGYVRVSSVRRRKGERFISPAVQRELIQGWAAMRGARVLKIFEELDESGRRGDRPLLEQALRRVESGISQGIVVSKVDRFGRSLLSGLAAIERVRAAGGTFVAVEDGLDMSTDTGRLVVRVLLSLGEWESERIATSWEHAHARAIARGVYSAPGAPVGYRRTRSGRLRPDPRTAEVIADVFRRRADGETGASLARSLEARGVRTGQGHPGWPPAAIRRLLANRAYLGEVSYGSHVNEHAHPPLVDAATWQAAQHPRRAIVLHKPDRMLLARLVRCAGCSMVMTAFARWEGERLREVFYRCNRHSAAGRCPAPAAITALYLDAYVEEHTFALLRRRRNAPAIALTDAEQGLAAATAGLARYRDSDRVLEALGPEAFAAGLAVRTERVRAARLHLAAARDAHSVYALPSADELEHRWVAMTDHKRRGVIAQVINCVFVSRGQLHAEDRVTVCRAGTAPQLPSTSAHHGGGARPFTADANHDLPALVPWPAKRIERELAAYLHGQRTWPTATSFVTAGRRRLYDQVLRHAGVMCWAHHFGLPTVSEPRSREPWTEPRIRAALELYLRRKRRFPTAMQFCADGLGSLHRAVMRTGGMRRWSTELGIPVAPNQRRHRASYSTPTAKARPMADPIAKADLGERHVYKLVSRNLPYGVWAPDANSFIGIREKFGSRSLFAEVINEPSGNGTAAAIEDTGVVVPDHIVIEETLGSVCSVCGAAASFKEWTPEEITNLEAQAGRARGGEYVGRGRWLCGCADFLDSRPNAVLNRPLFELLEEIAGSAESR